MNSLLERNKRLSKKESKMVVVWISLFFYTSVYILCFNKKIVDDLTKFIFSFFCIVSSSHRHAYFRFFLFLACVLILI